MNELQQIVKNSKLTAEKIEDNLQHPFTQKELKPREVFDEIKYTVDNYFQTGNGVRALGYAGLRGTGKTTLLWQAAVHIYKNYTQNIYFFNLQDLISYNIGIKEIQKAFETYIVKDYLAAYKEKIVLIFDEVHESPMWARSLKVLYDEFRIAFILASGSSALLLQSTADLVTRMLIQHIFPLNFCEYIGLTHSASDKLSDIRQKLEDCLIRSENAEELFKTAQRIKPALDNYLEKIDNIEKRVYDFIVYRNIIRFLAIDSDVQVNSQIKDLVRRVIYEDIPMLSDYSTHPHNTEKILSRIAASDEINIQTLSQTTGISQNEINDSLDILVKAELLNVLYPFGGIDSKISKTKKYFFMSPSVRKAILTPLITDTGNIYAKMLEDIVVLYLKRIFRSDSVLAFSTKKGQKNPDFIIETLPKPIILEVGMNKKTMNQIRNSKIDYKYGIIVNAKTNEIVVGRDSKVVIIPLKYFLLL